MSDELGAACNILSRETRNDATLMKELQRRIRWLEDENQQLRIALAQKTDEPENRTNE